ncbi:hypothetical protein THOM_0026 [Trachipleistophora hominis]|uniref:Uncharacterized protein n=1 Tax=Trachipleistophora hominis TaxID=72359 RepID=L7JZX8_TRAHO|nr:hypothetical protein THOM_0026 [Trachipleistophora hominis]
MLPVIIIIFSSLILVFSILRRKSVDTCKSNSTNLDAYYGLKENANNVLKTKALLEAAIANLKQREDNYSKKYIIQQMYNQRLLSPKIWDNLRTLIKDLEYEQLVIEAEAELIKPGWNIFGDASKMLPHQKKREEKMDKENRTRENSFLLKKKETLENQLMTKLMEASLK